MSYLNVSGLSDGGEDDALRKLMGRANDAYADDAAEAGKNPFLEAMRRAGSDYDVLVPAENGPRTSAPSTSNTASHHAPATAAAPPTRPSQAAQARAKDAATQATPAARQSLPAKGGNRQDRPARAADAKPAAEPLPKAPTSESPSATGPAKGSAAASAPATSFRKGQERARPSHAATRMEDLKQDVSSFQADNPVDVDALPPLPDLVHPKLRRPLTETLKIQALTRIQKLSWGAMVDHDKDVLMRSETGSGKTLAYALPVFHEVLVDCDTHPVSRDVGTIVVIMCPTRELVLQVTDTASSLLRCAQFLTVGGIHGGENRHKEKARLRKGIAVLVTTPGRLLDHLKATASFSVANVRTMIMDEADRLLDLGFERPIREIMELMERKCKNASNMKRVLVSATITDGVERLTHFALRRNIARIGETQDTFSIPATLRQHFVTVPTKHRLAVLISFLRSQFDAGASKIVVFVSTADSTEFLYYLLSRLQSPFNKKGDPFVDGKRETHRGAPVVGRSAKKMMEMANQHVYGESDEVVTFDEDDDGSGSDSSDDELSAQRGGRKGASLRSSARKSLLDVNVFKLHGNMSQVDRASVFHSFKHGNPNAPNQRSVLFCTDVAARGLDMPMIDWIVHYDPPTDPPSYIHRVGRTARIGRSGDSILFLAPHEAGYANYLVKFVQAQGHGGSAPANAESSDAAAAAVQPMLEKKYETYLFYLTKLDPKSNHMWMQSTAVLEHAICRLVMRDEYSKGGAGSGRGGGRGRGFGGGRGRGQYAGDGEEGEGDASDRKDNLTRIALFAYQSYIRAYAGLPKKLKTLFFPSTELHLGHVAQSFGIDKSPTELQRALQGYVREDRLLARDNRKGTVNTRLATSAGEDGDEERSGKRQRQRIELDHDERYHSMLAQKQRKLTRDYIEKRRETSTSIKPLQFSEFDA